MSCVTGLFKMLKIFKLINLLDINLNFKSTDFNLLILSLINP